MVAKFIIETNVAIVANGKDGKGIPTHASLTCQLICTELLLDVYKKLHVVIDSQGLIMKEYSNHLSYAGQPGVGDIFFKYLHDNQHAAKKIHQIAITPSNDTNRGFEELPVNQLDPSDRKFLATALVAKATIINATDSDWAEQKELLESLSVEVRQLCPEHCCK